MDCEFPDSVLLIFCKAPVPGQVKTRLQAAMSADEAAAVHQQLALMTLRRAVEQTLCPVILYCAPDCRHGFFQHSAQAFRVTLAEQTGCDLGERMHNAFDSALADYRHALLMGCDCPSLTAEDLRQGLMALRAGYDVTIAPAEDGGYVLIGLSATQPSLFEGMAWGTDSVMQATRHRALEANLSLSELRPQWDVDTIDDWRRYLREFG